MSATTREVGERHAEGASHARLHVMNLAGEAVRRQPLGQAVGVEKSLVNARRRRFQDAMKFHGTGHDDLLRWVVPVLVESPLSVSTWPVSTSPVTAAVIN